MILIEKLLKFEEKSNFFHTLGFIIGISLKELVDDPNWFVRKQVAKQGYGLGLLVNDPDEDVRVEVAKHVFGLNTLKNDESQYVQAEAKLQLAKRKRN